MNIKIVNHLNDESWDKFVEESNNGTIFHTLKFLQYHPQDRFKFFNLAFYEKEKLIAVLPGAIKDGIFQSPAGASYGSFVTKQLSFSFSQFEELIDSFLIFTKKKKVREIYLTPSPIIYQKKENELEAFLLTYRGFKIKQSLYTSAINLNNHRMSKRFRNDIVYSDKSRLYVKIDSSDWSSFYPILVENKKKFETVPTHSLAELIRLKKLFPNKIFLFMAYKNSKEPIAGIVAFLTNSKTALIFYISHYYQFREYKPVSRLLNEVITWAKNLNLQWLDLGVSMDTFSKNPMEPSRNLIFFKETTGSLGFLRTTYHLKFK